MNDREEEKLGFDEFKRKKRGSGKVASSRNPKGAGRPTREWSEYQQFKEWQKLQSEGFTSRKLSEIIGGFRGDDSGHGKADNKRDYRRLVGFVAKRIGFKEKDIQKMNFDKVDEFANDIYKELAPHAIPKMLTIPMKVAGFVLWYIAEEYFTVRKKFSPQEWESVPRPLKKQYYYKETDDEGNIHATRKRLQPQIMHGAVIFLQMFMNAIGGLVKFFTGDWLDADQMQNALLERFEQEELYKLGIHRASDSILFPTDIVDDPLDEDTIPEFIEPRVDAWIDDAKLSWLINYIENNDEWNSILKARMIMDMEARTPEEREQYLVEWGYYEGKDDIIDLEHTPDVPLSSSEGPEDGPEGMI